MIGKIRQKDLRKFYTLNRRHFLQVAGLSGAGFLIGCKPSGPDASPPNGMASKEMEPDRVVVLGPFIKIGTDNTVTVLVKHLDKGQGVTTGLPTIVAEELDADWSQMRAEFAPANAAIYNNFAFGAIQGTGGSTSIANSWTQLRTAAAAARDMLVQAAAEEWGVPGTEISVSQGRVHHLASKRDVSFGELAVKAADMVPPQEPKLKDPKDFKLIGTHVPRLDSKSKTDGSAVFTIDVKRPNMLVAVVAHTPKFGAAVKSFDATQARAVDGVSDVVQILRGVAVIADSYFSANKGREALSIEWDFSNAETRSSEQMFADYEALTAKEGAIARNDGDAKGTLAKAKSAIKRTYKLPFLAHAPMEPMDCVVDLQSDRCEIWTGTQIPTLDKGAVAQITGLMPEQVVINTHFAGGSFGRRAVPDSDYVAEAAMIAKAINGRAPIKLIWSREDDMGGGRYRPMSYHVLEGSLENSGDINAWRHSATIQSFMKGTPFEGDMANGIDASAVEGTANLPYAIPNMQVDLRLADNGVPTLWWRSVGHTQNAFVTEVFFDELVQLAGKDPVEVRRAMLREHPRHLGVLNLAAEKAGWGEKMGPGRGRGIAVHESFNSFVAEVVDVTVNDDNSFSVDRVVCAVDCGIAVNPDVVTAQMEGGIAYALSAALREEVTLVDGEVQEQNFHMYKPLRINEMPEVEVHILPSSESPTGVGEPGVPPLAPALINALAAASGKRIYTLPIGEQLKS